MLRLEVGVEAECGDGEKVGVQFQCISSGQLIR